LADLLSVVRVAAATLMMVLILTLSTLNLGSVAAQEHQQAEGRGLELALQAKDKSRGWVDMQVQMTMLLRDAMGRETTRELRVTSKETVNDGDKNLYVFESPGDIRGSAFLSYSHITKDDEQWLYLPALKRVKRIASASRAGAFMGSEFAYEDLSSFEVEKYRHRYLGDESCQGGVCHIVEQIPVDHNSGYAKRQVWQDQQHSRIWKIDYYDQKGQLLKTLVSSDFSLYLGKHWRPKKVAMQNHQTGKSTSLVYHAYRFNTGIMDRDFHKSALQRAY
jgi:outer membrane lipoprotein-sorting protein